MKLTRRERQVLLCYANGMASPAIARTLLLSHHTVSGYRKAALEKLEARNITQGVATAWRLCLIDGDEIDGGPIESFEMTRDEIDQALLNYREKMRARPPPVESWKALRERAALLALAYRGTRPRVTRERAGIMLHG